MQFCGKLIPKLSTLEAPLNHLLKKNAQWKWGAEEQASFQRLKDILCTGTVLAHFDPSQQIGIACNASEKGIGAVLFHRYSDGSERPVANVSKTLTDTQSHYSHLQREALAVIFCA